MRRNFRISDISFPNVAGVTGDLSSSQIVWPSDGGFLQGDALNLGRFENGRNLGTYYPGLALQFVAYYSDWGGLYLAAEDGAGYLKKFEMDGGSGNGLSCSIMHLVPDPDVPVQIYSHPYQIVLAAFQGDWQDAADLYKPWAEQQRWCRTNGRLSDRNDFSWLQTCAVFYYAKGWALPLTVADIDTDLYQASQDPPLQKYGQPPTWSTRNFAVNDEVLQNGQRWVCVAPNPAPSEPPPMNPNDSSNYWMAWNRLDTTSTPLSKAVEVFRQTLDAPLHTLHSPPPSIGPIGMHWDNWAGRGGEDSPLQEPVAEATQPLGDSDTLTQEIERIHAQGVHLLGYIGGRGWAIDIPTVIADIKGIPTSLRAIMPPCDYPGNGYVGNQDAGKAPPDWNRWLTDGLPFAVNLTWNSGAESPTLDPPDEWNASHCWLAYDEAPQVGDIVPVAYQLVTMCPGSTGWQNRIVLEATRICEYGGNGAYIDQGGFPDALPCINSAHGHPVAGGTWWQEGYRRTIENIRNLAASFWNEPEFVLSTEGCAEQYIDAYNLFLTQYRYEYWLDALGVSDGGKPNAWGGGDAAKPIPLFQYIYHAYTYVYGQAPFLEKSFEQLNICYSIILNEGSIFNEAEQYPHLNNGAFFSTVRPAPGGADVDRKLRLLASYVQLRTYLIDVLNLGEMRRVPKVFDPAIDGKTPDSIIIRSAWSGPNQGKTGRGDLVFIFSNPTDEPLSDQRWRIPPGTYDGEPSGYWTAFTSDPSRGFESGSQLPALPPWDGQQITVTLEASQTLVLQWASAIGSAPGHHFYTSAIRERDRAIAIGYIDEGTVCYAFPNGSDAGTVPLHRLFNPQGGDHFYTTSDAERDEAVAVYGYRDEGESCYVFQALIAGTVPLHRLFNPQGGDHFYTTSDAERNEAVAVYGYRDEGESCYVFQAYIYGLSPLYRLFFR